MAKFLSEEQGKQIIAAIQAAENNCSGEVRVHFDAHCKGDTMEAAIKTFDRLGMQKTALHNGVLFYVAYGDRKFAVIGDEGINSKVPENFWNNICDLLTEYFKKGDFVGGLTKGIELCGDQLKMYFPHQRDDKNELTDEISYGE
ncbi:MAG: TPM domain-containing protein [Bacteroidales bacterium]|nr:TPM domain-containing protein [Bacteroidales bacterium]